MPASFDELLGSLHENANMAVTDAPNAELIVGSNRKITAVADFDTTIAYEGDINSKTIYIQIPRYSARHELSSCSNKELKWKNLSSGLEGISKLEPEPVNGVFLDATEVTYVWDVPAELTAQAGNIEISIVFYDMVDNLVGFAWNTASYTGLKVEKTMSTVGAKLPARDEILLVDEDAHNIIAPVGYNNTVCNYGDKGVSEVYFALDRYFGKDHSLDVMDDNTEVFVVVVMNELIGLDKDNITKQLYTPELSDRTREGMVLISWKVPVGLTAGNGGPGKFKVALGIQDANHRWCSNTYDKLTVGHSLFEYNPDGEPEPWGLTTDFVEGVIDNYFNNGMIVFDPDPQK